MCWLHGQRWSLSVKRLEYVWAFRGLLMSSIPYLECIYLHYDPESYNYYITILLTSGLHLKGSQYCHVTTEANQQHKNTWTFAGLSDPNPIPNPNQTTYEKTPLVSPSDKFSVSHKFSLFGFLQAFWCILCLDYITLYLDCITLYLNAKIQSIDLPDRKSLLRVSRVRVPIIR